MKSIVLMADVLNSQRRNGNVLMDQLLEVVNFTNQVFASSILSPLTITLGDEFQGVVNHPKNALEMVLGMEEWIIENNWDFKLRYVILEGTIDTPINPNVAHEMLGEGLTGARKMLTAMKKGSERFHVSIDDAQKAKMLNDTYRLIQHFIDGWSAKDWPTVSGFLNGLDYKELASKLGKDDSSVWRRRKSLAIDEYNTCKSLIEQIIHE